ncbi:MAG TPA: S4 domain-containing protein [Polyangia bacterium]|nr:S4 domain-containing protein [Polyangia bacterium]
MRLQRFLAQAGVSSRRQAEQLITAGAVSVDGQVVTTLGTSVRADARVEVEGKRVFPEKPIYRLMLKPRMCLSTFGATGERPTLKKYVRAPEPGLQIVAPLDFLAEGVILLTTDGELAQAITKGKREKGGLVPMTYHLKLQGKVKDEDLGRLLKGWRWEGRPIKPMTVEPIATTDKNTWIEMVVAETRPRALKGGCEWIRHTLLKISRVRFGGISFEGLKMGDVRELSKAEVADLRKRAGLEA